MAGFAVIWAIVCIPLLVSPLGGYPVVDAAWHIAWAGAAAEGDTFVYAPYFRAPFYPLILSLVFRLAGSSVVAGALLNFVFGLLSVHLVHRIVYGRGGRWSALLAASATGLSGVFLFYSSTILITPMYIFLLLLAFYLLDRDSPASPGWFILGLACITRPSACLLLPLGLILYRKIWKSSWLFFLPIIAVWAVNWSHGDGGTVISSQAGINFYIGSGPEADGFTSFAPSVMESTPPGDPLPYVDNVWASSLSIMESPAKPSEVSARWMDRTVEHILQHPGSFLLLLVRKAVLLVSPVAIPSNYDVYYLSRYSPALRLLVGTPQFPVSSLILWALLPAVFFAGAISGRQWNPALWAAVLAVGILPFFVTARFGLPVMPFAVIFLAPIFFRQPGKNLRLAPIGVAAGAGLALLTADTVGTSGVNMAFYDGMAHYQKGDAEMAETLFLQAVEVAMERDDGIDLNGTDALYNLGVIALRRGDIREAESYWELALGRDPAFYPARQALQGLTPQFH